MSPGAVMDAGPRTAAIPAIAALAASATGAAVVGLAALALSAILALLGAPGPARAEPFTPRADEDIVETLPTLFGVRRAGLQTREQTAGGPANAEAAVQAARAYLALAHRLGDARYAGLAQGRLRPWTPAGEATPIEVLVAQADIAQYLHEFEPAIALLQRALRRAPRHAQAWLTLATVHRVQGRYAQSSQACRQVIASGHTLHGQACLAENLSLQGQRAPAARLLAALLEAADPADIGIRRWLLTSIAENEERGAQYKAADAAWRAANALVASGAAGSVSGETAGDYPQTAYADFLLDRGRAREALALLHAAPDTDAVLLRKTIAAQRAADPRADTWREDLQARWQAAAARPSGQGTHAREQARFALDVLGRPAEALALARLNLARQRETADLLLMARAAQAQPDAKARAEATAELARLIKTIGAEDARLDDVRRLQPAR